MSETPNTGIPYVPENTLDPAAGLNLALNVIDALLQTAVLELGRNDPPGSPSDGDLYIVGVGTGAWAGQDDNLARYVAEGDFWQFYVAGVQVHIILNLGDAGLYRFDGSSGWGLAAGLGDAPSDGSLYARRDGAWESFVAGGGESAAPVIELSGDSYSLEELTNGAWHEFTNGSAVTITVMDDSAEPIESDAEFGLMASGAGGVTIVIDDVAVIVPPKGGTLELEPGDFALLKRRAADLYKLVGETAAPP